MRLTEEHHGLAAESLAAKIWKHIPAACAFILLACQTAVPWTVPHFVTTDGPSHLYGATVARDLVFNHKHSIYSALYTIQRSVIPNWLTTVVLAATSALAGTAHAEQFFASLSILAGFFGLSYLSRALAPEKSPWSPVMNFAVQTSYLWAGFYNFYLGMVLLPWLIGFHIRSIGRLNFSRALVIAIGLVGLFFTHLIAAVLAITTTVAIAGWVWITGAARNGRSDSARAIARRARAHLGLTELGLVLLAAIPTIILILIYTHSTPPAT